MKSAAIRATLTMGLAALLISCVTSDPMIFSFAPLHGVAYDESRLPVGGVQVRVSECEPVLTDVDGRFTIANVPRGTLELDVTRPGYRDIHDLFRFENRTDILYLKIESLVSLRRTIERKLVAGDLSAATRLCVELLDAGGDDPLNRYLAVIAFHMAGEDSEATLHLDWLRLAAADSAPVEMLAQAVSESNEGESE